MTDQEAQPAEFHANEIRRFARMLALLAALLAALPVLIGVLARPEGQSYLPFHLSLDDHMVYAAWMRQAAEGQVLFDNRFTTDAQPGLTFHVLFLLLGWLAKFVGIPLTLTLARIGFSYLAVRLLAEFLIRCGLQSFTGKFALVTSVFGGGVAFLNWHTFGDAYAHGPSWLTSLLQGRQPIDNWQPEGFLFPSMLTNGLFMAALCLILWTLNCVIDSRSSWKPVVPGAIAFGLLMNVHSYDIALIAMVLVAFAATLLSTGQLEGKWALRTVVIGLGAVPAALWFLNVLANDPVFKARAETLTYTGGFREIVFGTLPLMLLAVLALARSDLERKRKILGCSLLAIIVFWLWIASSGGRETYVVGAQAWIVLFIFAVSAAVVVSKKDVGWNLLWSWAMVSLVAPYFPMLFQRKLSMMLAVPWAIIAAIGLTRELLRMERQQRNLVAAIALAVVCLSSIFWLRRDVELVQLGVSKTAQHNLFLTTDESAIVDKLNQIGYGQGVISIPGAPDPSFEKKAFITDLSPILSGLTGVYSYAGHWSETPHYNERRAEVTSFYIGNYTNEQRLAMLKKWGITYVVAPQPQAYEGASDLSGLGETVYQGSQLSLLKIGNR